MNLLCAKKTRRSVAGIVGLALLVSLNWGHLKIMNSSADSARQATHPLCIGRYLVDVPGNYKLEDYNYRIDGVDISWQYKINDRAAFEKQMAMRTSKLTNERNEYGKPSLEASQKLTSGEIFAVILAFDRTKPVYWFEGEKRVETGDNLSAEAWVWTGTHALRFDAKGLGPGFAQRALIRLIQPLKNLAAGTIPVEEGFCMEMFDARALIAGPPRLADTNEYAEIQFGLKDYRDVKFRLSFLPNAKKLEEPLSSRHAKVKAEHGSDFGRVSELRDGPLRIRDMEGYQLVESFWSTTSLAD